MILNQSLSISHLSALVASIVMSLLAVSRGRKGVWTTPPEKLLMQCILLWLEIHLPLSWLLLAAKTFENAAASFLFNIYHLPSQFEPWLT